MRLTLCRLTFHENLFYMTREAGRLYETGRYLHNYALTYALGLATAAYYQADHVPAYKAELGALNAQGIYVTPARGLNVRYQLVTFKFADNAYRVKTGKTDYNLPSFGRAKEVAVGSVFEFAVLHAVDFRPPRWIRMGLWRSKGHLEVIEQAELKPAKGEYMASLPLNPLDFGGRLKIYDVISMPPSSLVDHAIIEGDWLRATLSNGEAFYLPAGMRYTFPK